MPQANELRDIYDVLISSQTASIINEWDKYKGNWIYAVSH